jgi:putative nucleotidyltransferase with HDIG domain
MEPLTLEQDTGIASAEDRQRKLSRICDSLHLCFGTKFSVVDVVDGSCVLRGELPFETSLPGQMELCRAVSNSGRAEFIAEDDSVVILAVPLVEHVPTRFVALAPFVIRTADDGFVVQAATAIGCEAEIARKWVVRQDVWDVRRLIHLAELATSRWANDFRNAQLQREQYELSSRLSAAYEELNLLYGLTQKLKISGSIEDLGRKSLEWLAEAIPADGFALELLPAVGDNGEADAHSPNPSVFLKFGHCGIDRFQLTRLIEHSDFVRLKRPLTINASQCNGDWPLPEVKQAVIVPLTEGDNLLGWLVSFNREERTGFGTSEATLLSSVAAILGVHACNLALYRRQAEFVAGVVRALTSAIDAKDPYTCGHSDRVARIAVHLAEQMGCNSKELETLYLSGLLHDIGKIGIDDHVLRKAGKLTVAEYEHIKVHAEIGYRILKDLKQLDQVLPVVRHHHEAWDGSGYPRGLAGENIPLYARIVAVADACDAMSSDRPYRKGFPEEKIDDILRHGAGSQWDPQVIEAYFAVRDEIRDIEQPDRDGASTPELAQLS